MKQLQLLIYTNQTYLEANTYAAYCREGFVRRIKKFKDDFVVNFEIKY